VPGARHLAAVAAVARDHTVLQTGRPANVLVASPLQSPVLKVRPLVPGSVSVPLVAMSVTFTSSGSQMLR
jgi:hypothetical protein